MILSHCNLGLMTAVLFLIFKGFKTAYAFIWLFTASGLSVSLFSVFRSYTYLFL